MRGNWLVIGIAGATCSGKTTVAEKLSGALKNSKLLKQDEYFLPVDDPRHTRVPELNHLNWELLTSLDMDRMLREIEKILGSKVVDENGEEKRGILILEGFLLFNCKELADLCDLRYFLELSREECWERRKIRTYDPPDVPNYFDKIVWPEYVKARAEILANEGLKGKIFFLDGVTSSEETFDRIFNDVKQRL